MFVRIQIYTGPIKKTAEVSLLGEPADSRLPEVIKKLQQNCSSAELIKTAIILTAYAGKREPEAEKKIEEMITGNYHVRKFSHQYYLRSETGFAMNAIIKIDGIKSKLQKNLEKLKNARK